MKEMISFAQAYEIADQIAIIEITSEKVNAETKKQLYIDLFDNLKKNGVEEDHIVSEAHKLIEESLQTRKKDILVKFNNDSWFYEVANLAGYGRSPPTDNKNTSTFTKVLTGECVKLRNDFIQFLTDTKEDADGCIEILKRNETKDESGNDIKIAWGKFFNEPDFSLNLKFIGDHFYADRELWRQQRDSRQSILPLMRLPILALTSVVTNKWLCAKYYALVKVITDITPKKLSQLIRDVKSEADLFKWVKEDSWKYNFMAFNCPGCKQPALKIRNYDDGHWDFVCKNWDFHKNDETHYPSLIYVDEKRKLMCNRGGSADSYLNKKGIVVVEN